MTTEQDKEPLPPLDPQVVRKLLDLLSTDDAFRSLFEQDAQAALIQAGLKPPQGLAGRGAPQYGACMQMQSGQSLASKEQIAQDRANYERLLLGEIGFTIPFHCSR